MRISPFRIALVLALYAAFIKPVPSAQDVSEFEKRLARIHEQINDLKAKIKDADKKESSILSALARIGLQKSLIRREMEAGAVAFEKSSRELQALKTEIGRLQARIEMEKKSVEKTLVTLYKFGQFDFLQFMLKADNIESFMTESKHLMLLAKYQETVIANYLAALSDLRLTEGLLEQKKKEIADLLRSSAEKRKELEAEERKNRSLIDEIQSNKSTYRQTLEELDESARQLQALIKKIIDQEFTLPVPFIPLSERQGKLPWPVEGKIITSFGPQKHIRFNTTTMNNGIEIAPKKNGATVLSVHAGRVVYADTFEGYGNLLIIDHGVGYYSLYGHCSEFLASKGDLVQAGRPIALVGDTGSLKGECLYLEIRFKTRALDPLQWLKRR